MMLHASRQDGVNIKCAPLLVFCSPHLCPSLRRSYVPPCFHASLAAPRLRPSRLVSLPEVLLVVHGSAFTIATYDVSVQNTLRYACVPVYGISRLNLLSYASSFQIYVAHLAAISEKLYSQAHVCLHRSFFEYYPRRAGSTIFTTFLVQTLVRYQVYMVVTEELPKR
ncbi:hypothetical protein HN51_036312 [Arachis hypogaea]